MTRLKVSESIDLAELAAPIFGEDLYWFPVRHHSPAAAYFVAKAITARKPRCLLLEASTHFQHLLPFLLNKTKPPIALYSSARLDGGKSSARAGTSWFPLVDYSPEWQAIQAANKVGAEIRFIDLPHYCQPNGSMGIGPTEENNPSDDSVSFFQSLADQAGYLNWHECWDALFEHTLDAPENTVSYDRFRQQLLYFAAAARSQSMVDESSTLLARECYMWGNIQSALAHYDAKDTMVVCGALHAFMARDESGYQPLCTEVAKTEKELSVNTTIVPYSYRRITMQHGYGAGNRAPWFYYQLWRNRQNPDRRLLEHIREILSVANKLGHPTTSADNLAVAHHAKLLAQLRNREHPVLDDIEDAVWACCCKGNPDEAGARLSKAISRANIGIRIGTVNPDLGQLPLVTDFYEQLQLLEVELPALDERRTIRCDLRTVEGLARSQFFHRLRFLDLPCVKEEDLYRTSQAKLFSESWSLTAFGSDETLIEYSEFGDTIDSVVQSRIAWQIESHALEIDKLASTLTNSQLMGLGVFHGDIPAHLHSGLQQCGNFNTLALVFQSLLKIWNQQKFLDSIEPATQPLLALCFFRSTLALGKVVDVQADEQAVFVAGLRVLAEAWLSMNDLDVDREVFEQVLVKAISDQKSPLVDGCCFGLLLESGKRTTEEFSAQLESYTRYSSGDSLQNAAIWLEGVMYTTKVSILGGADKISQAIDKLLRQASQQDFLLMLPRLRAGFEALPNVQCDALAIGVAKMYGLESTQQLKKLPTDHVQDLSQMDQQVQDIMERWGLNT